MLGGEIGASAASFITQVKEQRLIIVRKGFLEMCLAARILSDDLSIDNINKLTGIHLTKGTNISGYDHRLYKT